MTHAVTNSLVSRLTTTDSTAIPPELSIHRSSRLGQFVVQTVLKQRQRELARIEAEKLAATNALMADLD